MRSLENRVLAESEYFIHSPSAVAKKNFYYPVHVGHFYYDAGYRLKRNAFDSFLLLYVISGTLFLDNDNGETAVGKGRFLLLDCYRPHSYFTRDKCETLWIHFDGQNARGIYQLVAGRTGRVFSMQDPHLVFIKITQIFDAFNNNDPIRESQFSRWIYDMLMDVQLYAALPGEDEAKPSAVAEAAAYIREHYKESPSIEELAKIAALSPYHFIRIFRKETGMTPHEYIIDLKIRTAKYLLRHTALTTKEICESAGFSCESVFYATFRRICGHSPKEYRTGVPIA